MFGRAAHTLKKGESAFAAFGRILLEIWRGNWDRVEGAGIWKKGE